MPFGSQHMPRSSWFPYLGVPPSTAGTFNESFDPTWSQRWTVFGGNWVARDGTLSTVPASANGAKALAMATVFTNFTYEADVSVGPAGNAGLIFRVSKPDIGADAYCGYYVGINSQNSSLELGCVSNSWHAITNISMTFSARYILPSQNSGSRFTNSHLYDWHESTVAGCAGWHFCQRDAGRAGLLHRWRPVAFKLHALDRN